ncbi:MAG TPA: hypothetical protein VFP56_09845 [Candidatus Limnocylindrales bacterium]|nr:hypothetical protein [Candidatus Limnocylindrales bacterium]
MGGNRGRLVGNHVDRARDDRAGCSEGGGTVTRLLAVIAAIAVAAAGQLAHPSPAWASWGGSISVSFGNGDGAGRVTSDDDGIDCRYANGGASGDCSQTYIFPDFQSSVLVTITYTPSQGSYLCVGSAGGCVTSGAPHSVTLEFRPEYGNVVTLTPRFELTSYRLQARIDGPGTISSNGTPCSPSTTLDWCALFKHGTTATLTAQPAAGSIFTYWSGNPCTGFDPVCSLTVTEDSNYLVVFGKVNISLDIEGSGTACATSGARLCTEGLIPPVSNFIAVGTTLVIEAKPEKGWRFDHWNSGPCGGQGLTCTFTVKAAKSLVATFKRIPTATPTPKPTPKPTPRATPATVATPRPTAPSTPVAVAPPAASAEPAPTLGAGEQPLPTWDPPPSVLQTEEPVAPAVTLATSPVPSFATVSTGAASVATGPDGLMLLLLVLLAAGAFALLGFALGRRRGATRPRA